MNYFACLGPIDPQIEKDGKLAPALSYLNQFQRLSEKAENGTLNTAEFALLNKLDLGELYPVESEVAQAAEANAVIPRLLQHEALAQGQPQTPQRRAREDGELTVCVRSIGNPGE